VRRIITTGLAALLVLVPLASATAQTDSTGGGGSDSKYDGIEGPYTKIALDIGWANIKKQFVPGAGTPFQGQPAVNTLFTDVGTGVGLAVAAGYRFSSWMSGDVELFFVGGADVSDPVAFGVIEQDASTIGLTFNAKAYPLGFFKNTLEGLSWLQPYATFGMGVGFSEFAAPISFGSTNEQQFLVRFGAGLDVLFGDHWGVYMDGSYYITNKEVMVGIGSLQFGGIYRF
jgi:hypothetical protein